MKPKRLLSVMPIFLLFALILFASGLPVFRFIRLFWSSAPGIFFWVIWIFPPLCFFIGFDMKRGKPKSVMRRIGTGWFGLMLYPTIIILSVDLLWAILLLFEIELPLMQSGIAVICICAVIFVYGLVNALTPRVTKYSVKLPVKHKLRLVLISDLHLGFYSGLMQTRRIVKKCNLYNADAVMIAGDLFDEEYSAVRNSKAVAEELSKLQSRLGVFACEGNHDNYCPSPLQDEFAKAANIHLLRDEAAETDDFAVFCRRDLWKGRIPAKELLDRLDSPLKIVLDHNPAEFEDSIDAGANLVLCGHTHNGQTFPGNLLIKLRKSHGYGLKAYKNGFCIVTSGAGIWGFPMKVGVKSEIAVIDIYPDK